jgi:hypothetical protein
MVDPDPAQPDRKRGPLPAWWAVGLFLLMAFVLYAMSLGPVIALMDHFPPPDWLEAVLDAVYMPLEWLYDHSGQTLKRLFDSYIDWWYNLFD